MSGFLIAASLTGSAIAVSLASQLDAAALDYTAGVLALYWLTFGALLARTLVVHHRLRGANSRPRSR